MKTGWLLAAMLPVALACKSRPEPQLRTSDPLGSGSGEPAAAPGALAPAKAHDAVLRIDFNRLAVRLNLPLYWTADTNNDKQIDPDEVAALLFYPSEGRWVQGGKFTPEFDTAYDQIVAASKAPLPDAATDEGKRLELVGKDLDAGRATLVRTDLSSLSSDDMLFVRHMLTVAKLIDELYAIQNGSAKLADLPKDSASQSLFRRNRGPTCAGPATEHDPLCSAIAGAPKPAVTVYPASISVSDGRAGQPYKRHHLTQSSSDFCKTLEKASNAKALLEPFAIVREESPSFPIGPNYLVAVTYTRTYGEMAAISTELGAAANTIKDPSETALVTYLRAAALSFTTNDWTPADEAWAKMTVDNSKWYVRVGPDEVYWEPCAHKAGFHLTFARINQGSKAWQAKLVPVQQEMEAAIAERAGAPYAARKVTFHLPDFIDIIINAGDDRTALGATIGQSLPNWGPVANEGRGRTVAMVNLYGDPDSLAARRAQAESLLDRASMASYASTQEPGLLSTILHEATHNLGPAHEYKASGKTAGELFGGPMASVMEELKAQTGALFLLEFLRQRKIISDELASQSLADSIVWAFGHISQGMYTGAGERKTYSNLAAIQIGFLIDRGALTWDAKATAANGKDQGAFTIHSDKIVPAVHEMMKVVGGIKARGDKVAADALGKRYVDGTSVVPHKVIAERFLRFPKASFVYAVVM